MQITKQIKLCPTAQQEKFLVATTIEYIRAVNEMTETMFWFDDYGKYTSKNIEATLPSALRDQCRIDAKNIFKRFRKRCREDDRWNQKHLGGVLRETKLPTLHKPVATWNNQNFTVLKLM